MPFKKLISLYQTHPGASRFFKGLLAFGLGNLLNMLTRILLPPLFLYAWGVHIYGNWLLLASIVTYLTITSMGGQLYIVNKLTQLFNTSNKKEFATVFNSGLFLLVAIAIVVLCIFSLIVFIIQPAHILKIRYISPEATRWVLIILAIQFLSSLPQGLLTGTFQSIGKLPTGVMLNNLMIAGQVLFPALALLSHYSPIYIATAQVLPIFFVISIAVYILRRKMPDTALFKVKQISLKTIISFIKPSLHFLLIQISYALTVEGLILVTGLTLGPVQVVMFATMRTLINMMKQSLGLLFNTAWPELTRLDATHNIARLRQIFKFVLRSTLIASFVIIIILNHFGEFIYTIWLHHKISFDHKLMLLFLAYGFELIFWTSCANLLMAVNKHHKLAYIYFINACFTILLAYLGSKNYALLGLVCGMLIADTLLPFWLIPLLVYKYYRSINLRFYLIELLPIIAGVLCCSFSLWAALFFLPLLGYWWYKCMLVTK